MNGKLRDTEREALLSIANTIRLERYADAAVVFVAGSLLRGEGTRFSDLDLVVVYPFLECAYRESFHAHGYPVEAFVHDPDTLEYFLTEVDRPSAVPALPEMVVQGVPLPAVTPLSTSLQRRATALIAAGPPALTADEEQRMRYGLTDLLDDLREPRSREELIGTATRLYGQLADYYLRRGGHWSGAGKAIPRVLQRVNADFSTHFTHAFDQLFTHSDIGAVVDLAESVLNVAGGPLFDGFMMKAPVEWRRPTVKDAS